MITDFLPSPPAPKSLPYSNLPTNSTIVLSSSTSISLPCQLPPLPSSVHNPLPENTKETQTENYQDEEKEELRFLYSQLAIEVGELMARGQNYQREIRGLNVVVEELREENFWFRERVGELEEEKKEWREVSERKIREEYQSYYTKYEQGLKEDVEKVMKAKDEIIEELKNSIRKLTGRGSQFQNIRKMRSQFGHNFVGSPRQVQSPATSTIDLWPLLENMRSEKKFERYFREEEGNTGGEGELRGVGVKQERRRLMTEPISPIKLKQNTRSKRDVRGLLVSQRGRNGKCDKVLRGGKKVNFVALEKELELLSAKLRKEIGSMSSLRK